MAQVQVTVRTVEKDTTRFGGSECKFYRTYEIPGHGTIFQWGSMKNGKSGGQFKFSNMTYDAATVVAKKVSEGYTNELTTYITVDTARVQISDAKSAGTMLDNIHAASGTPFPTGAPTKFTPKPKPSTKPTGVENSKADNFDDFDLSEAKIIPDRLGVLNRQALEAISLASTDPIAALKELSKITDEIEAIEADVRKVRSYVNTLEVLTEELV